MSRKAGAVLSIILISLTAASWSADDTDDALGISFTGEVLT